MKRLLTIFGILAVVFVLQAAFVGIDGQQNAMPQTDTTGINVDTLQLAAPSQTGVSQTPAAQVQETSVNEGISRIWKYSGFSNALFGNVMMIIIGLIFIIVAIKFEYEPLLLIPIAIGIILGNIPFVHNVGLQIGIHEQGSILNYLYSGVLAGIFPALMFLGIGAMTDFSSLIANPKLMLLGAAAQVGIFVTFLGALAFGFSAPAAGAIGIIGGADGSTALFISSKLANGINLLPNGLAVENLIAPISIAAYVFMALVPVIQPPIMRLLTSKKERQIRMTPPRTVSQTEKLVFSIVGLLLTLFIAPAALPLLGMFFFGNILKESGVTKRLALTASNPLIDIITIGLGLTIGAVAQAKDFLTMQTLIIFVLGLVAFIIATASGILFAKFMNLFLSKNNKINPLIGSAGVSAVPDSARVSQIEGLREDPTNHLLMHAMAPNVAGVIGSALVAGILISFLL
jgi:oxaloacetate decarboxylase beta subunit